MDFKSVNWEVDRSGPESCSFGSFSGSVVE
jgi:hypothetical protein